MWKERRGEEIRRTGVEVAALVLEDVLEPNQVRWSVRSYSVPFDAENSVGEDGVLVEGMESWCQEARVLSRLAGSWKEDWVPNENATDDEDVLQKRRGGRVSA